MKIHSSIIILATVTTTTIVWFYLRQKRQSIHQVTTLRAYQHRTTFDWIALCGTVFDVTHDPFFTRANDGLYSEWVGHDVTAMLLSTSVFECSSKTTPLDADVDSTTLEITACTASDSIIHRRRQVLEEWYARLYSRYKVVGQISDRMVGTVWDSLRRQFRPSSTTRSSRTRCPLGFGSSSTEQKRTITTSHPSREIRFQGRRYNVNGSFLFDGEHAPLAHFVGHDITYALSIHSNRSEDLDTEMKSCTYEQQVRLEQYRRLFTTELQLVVNPSIPSTSVDLHELVDKNNIQEVLWILMNDSSSIDLNVICPRTEMTLVHKAIEKNQLQLVQALVSAGANLSIKAILYDEDTPLQLAERFGYKEITQYLGNC